MNEIKMKTWLINNGYSYNGFAKTRGLPCNTLYRHCRFGTPMRPYNAVRFSAATGKEVKVWTLEGRRKDE